MTYKSVPKAHPLLRRDVDYMNDFGLGIKGAVELLLLADETARQFLVVEMVDMRFRRQDEFPSQVLDAILRARSPRLSRGPGLRLQHLLMRPRQRVNIQSALAVGNL